MNKNITAYVFHDVKSIVNTGGSTLNNKIKKSPKFNNIRNSASIVLKPFFKIFTKNILILLNKNVKLQDTVYSYYFHIIQVKHFIFLMGFP